MRWTYSHADCIVEQCAEQSGMLIVHSYNVAQCSEGIVLMLAPRTKVVPCCKQLLHVATPDVHVGGGS